MLLTIGCFFKQKTAYEMRISDWRSDVCSSDLPVACRQPFLGGVPGKGRIGIAVIGVAGEGHDPCTLNGVREHHHRTAGKIHLIESHCSLLFLLLTDATVADRPLERGWEMTTRTSRR